MKKNVLIKGILLLLVITLLAIGFTGCGAVYPTTGTVYITVDTWDDYSIYMDYYYQGYTGWYGSFTIYNVPIGMHTFKAYGYYYGYYGYTYQYIYSGNNYVKIYTY